ncbi:cob(I)alamin adenosyltransferase [Clostridium cavendishii DSM 21758]|uniref:Cob(I)alamin adenosyltransferase n=1 Tax=Clostridium cavendishii DSM 21758 TaxID=1121302 RepID=A0A1M6KZ26_9CLOT|nr:cob(I)yrinic acid a,c-diamide adenosyltransferase [Clostridium cavendishii]SHJ64231.1 cob(I)alamin adenosyltransferase [Clostridium cavendishii DSM 21758]
MGKLKKGYIQIYTGNGKGKTTAALGLGLRASGDNLVTYMIQFLKNSDTGELKAVENLGGNFKIFRFESPKDFVWNLNPNEIDILKKEINEAYLFAMSVLEKKECDILILDEIMGVLGNKFLTEEQVLTLMEKKPDDIELVMTGRNVPKTIEEKADLITEMKPIKHYFNKGVEAREGIEY